jgi:alkylation response protein AidB-like acyl-CoA dehydrogenase
MYDLLEKLADFRTEVRAFCEEKIAPHAVEVDEKQIISTEVNEAINTKGWWGCIVPKDYGGLGYSNAEYVVLVEEISRVCGSTGLTFAAHNSLGTFPISTFGTNEQRMKYLPAACKNGDLIAFGLTEPEAGSDAGGTKSKAVKDGDHYVINGTKSWITSAEPCKVAVITARTSDEGGVKGISSFILEKSMDGFSVGKKENKLGCRGSNTAFLHMDDVRVHESQRLGDEGLGFKQFMITLDGGRISIGAMALGIAQAAFELASKHAIKRKQFGKPISAYQAIQWKIADMATQIEAARHMVYGAAYLKDTGKPMTKESAMAKVFASEVANSCTYQAIQVLGGDGYSSKYPAERYYRDMKLCEIGEGTSEVQRIVIAREVFKSVSKID